MPEDSFAEYRGKRPEPKAFPGSKTYSPQSQPRAVRAAMITRLDRAVGRILELLDELKRADNTLIMFARDNGPITAGGQDPAFFQSSGPLRDLKFTLYEVGIRVPLLAKWRGKIAPGTTFAQVSDFADLFPTFLELAGQKSPAGLDGVSLVPTLLGQPARHAAREGFYWEAAPQHAVRIGDWKGYRAAPGRTLELHDLGRDLGETRNVASAHPDIVARLEKVLVPARTDSPDFPLQRREGKQP